MQITWHLRYHRTDNGLGRSRPLTFWNLHVSRGVEGIATMARPIGTAESQYVVLPEVTALPYGSSCKPSGKMRNSQDAHNKQTFRRSECPIVNTLNVIGDRWTLLIVRDLVLNNTRRYGELLASPERIPTNILADRLKRLEAYGLVAKTPYQQNPVRYEYQLTPRGLDLEPILQELIRWGLKHLPPTQHT